MKITTIELMRFAVPFRLTFRHALASRDKADSLIVRVHDERGRAGYGESAPRPYVTGETTDGAQRTINQILAPRWTGAVFDAFDDVVSAIRDAQLSLQRNEHAAFCALELAVLDLAGRVFHRSCGELLGPVTRPEACYSGVVSADDVERAIQLCQACRAMDLSAVKLKVGQALETDIAIVQAARQILGDGCSLRVDANGAWSADEALQRIEQFHHCRIDAVEQPVPAGDLAGLARLTAQSAVPIVVDESLVSYDDAKALIEARACHMFNIRVSKNGGLIGAARLRALANQHGVKWMLGAQVGETAILSAAGRQLATRGDQPSWCEGSFGALLLEHDISREDVTFARGGLAPALEGEGLGVTIDQSVLHNQEITAHTSAQPSRAQKRLEVSHGLNDATACQDDRPGNRAAIRPCGPRARDCSATLAHQHSAAQSQH
ncbi:MAG: hypothetical protein L0Y44_00820 [Phycisphaerales bacterium]|nr:hypothetical protein [Phycisphaerales bacterium]MCI0675720.1 hypothetical protein [Phycisphaerales bacterium]